MNIDIPYTMSDSEATDLTERIRIANRLINTRGNQIKDLLERGSGTETY